MKDEKIELRFQQLEDALASLEKIASKPVDQDRGNIDSTIKRFEYTFELFWKLLKAILEKRGLDLRFPADIFREAYMGHLINDEEMWIKMLKDRNLTTHTYNEGLADEIYLRIKQYVPIFRKNLSKLLSTKL